MYLQFRPIERWPVEPTASHNRRGRFTFKADWHKTMQLLDTELLHLSADNVVIQVDVDESQIRIDGMLRSGVEPRSPGVILSFESKHGPLSYPCDSCEFWRHNVRSIALALQALRKVDLYGVTKRAEQYKGWTSLPAPGQIDEFANSLQAKDFLEDLLEKSINWRDVHSMRDAFRAAKTISHPDAGGNSRRYKLVTNAISLIEGV